MPPAVWHSVDGALSANAHWFDFLYEVVISFIKSYIKVHIFLEGHKMLQNLHHLFDWQYIGQIFGGDFAKFCGLLRINELYNTYTLYKRN